MQIQTYSKIFFTFFKIGLFTFGGGYAMLPIIQNELINKQKWLSEQEFLDSIAITNSLPGPLSINCVAFISYRKFGLWGALVAVLGMILPSFLIILAIAMFLVIQDNKILEKIFLGVRPAVVALIIYSFIKLAKFLGISKLNIGITVLALLFLIVLHVHPIVIIIVAGFFGYLFAKKI